MRNREFLAGLAITLAAVLASVVLYPRLPDLLPIHWNIHGVADGFGPKAWAAFLMPGMMAAILLLFRVLPWLSPRHFEVESFRSTYLFVMLLMLGLLGYIHALMLWVGLAGGVDVGRAMVGGIFLFFALMGNVLGKVRRNFWMGVRTPWTLADEQVWNDTHRFAARLWVAIGVLGAAGTAAGLPIEALFAFLLVGALVPTIYSLARYKELRGDGEGAGRRVWIIAALLLAGIAAALWLTVRVSPARAPHTVPAPPVLEARARELVTHLSQGDPDAAAKDFDETMRRGLPPAKLRDAWAGMVASKGAFRAQAGVRAERVGEFTAVFVTGEFERGRGEIKVVFGRDGRVSGLWRLQ